MDYVITVAPFEDEMIPRARDLFATYFDDGSNLLREDYLVWLYRRNPFGAAKAVYVRHGDEWVGFMALVPVRLRKGAEALNAYFAVNVLVDPAHQGRNLFARMITAGCELAKGEDSALLGHPNAAALMFWRRKRMHFHEELRPALAIPRPRRWNIGSEKATSLRQLANAVDLLKRIPRQSKRWKVEATPDYLQWRFIEHPSHRYSVQVLRQNKRVIGLQIARQIRTGLNLLIDQYVEQDFQKFASARLPIATVCLVPDRLISEAKGVLLPLPVKRRIPFFLTNFLQPIPAEEASEMLLTASDF